MQVKSKKDIFLILQNNEKNIKSLGIKMIGLFGSYVRNEQKQKSDIDIIAEFHKDRKTFDNFMNLALLLENLLGRNVELVTSESLSPYIKPYIMKEIEYVPFTS